MGEEGEGKRNPENSPPGDAGGATGGQPDLAPATAATDDEAGPIGLFPNWPAVYGTVLVYGVLMILFLWVMTRILDPGVAP